MRELSFLGFLKRYLQVLGETDTMSIKKLAQEVLPKKRRIAEPLYLYAVLTGQQERLVKVVNSEYYKKEYRNLTENFSSKEKLMEALARNDGTVPTRYQKPYNSYLKVKSMPVVDKEYCIKAREVVLDLQQKLGITNYRLYTDLNLNPGNINDYLKNATVAHISRETVDRILEYLRNHEKQVA